MHRPVVMPSQFFIHFFGILGVFWGNVIHCSIVPSTAGCKGKQVDCQGNPVRLLVRAEDNVELSHSRHGNIHVVSMLGDAM